MSNFEFDIEGCSALLSGNDPNLNNGGGRGSLPSEESISGDSVINTTELLLPVVNNQDVDSITYMDSSDEEPGMVTEENVSDTENVSINPNTIHSYSVLKPKNTRT